MLKDESGQLLLIGAFMLAMTVVTISLMLNNVIYASDLAYVGFMDQTRYDNLGFKQVTADEMNYAYDNYYGTAKYNKYLSDYTDALNKVINIEGKYVELDSASPVVNDPHPDFVSNGDQHILSVFSKSSKASFAISTGTYSPAASTYAISLSTESSDTDITSDGIDKVKFIVHLTKNGVDAPNELITFQSNRIREYSFVPVLGGGFITDANGNLEVYYYDGIGGPGFAYITAYPTADSIVRRTVQISCVQPVGAPSPFMITLSPQTPTNPPYPILINDGVSNQQITATVKDTVTGLPVSGVFVRFHTNIGSIVDFHSCAAWETGLDGQPQWDIFYFGDQTQVTPYVADIYAYIEETNPDTISDNHVYLSCNPVVVIGDPTVDTAAADSKITPATHGSGYVIDVAFNMDPQLTNVNIAPISVSYLNNVALDSPTPYFNVNGGLNRITVTTKNIPNNKVFKIVLDVTFIGLDPNGAPYSKKGTLTIVGDNTQLFWDAANNPNYLTFP